MDRRKGQKVNVAQPLLSGYSSTISQLIFHRQHKCRYVHFYLINFYVISSELCSTVLALRSLGKPEEDECKCSVRVLKCLSESFGFWIPWAAIRLILNQLPFMKEKHSLVASGEEKIQPSSRPSSFLSWSGDVMHEHGYVAEVHWILQSLTDRPLWVQESKGCFRALSGQVLQVTSPRKVLPKPWRGREWWLPELHLGKQICQK